MAMTFHDAGLTHWCAAISEGEESRECSTGWACTIEDGACEGSAVCGDCRKDQYARLMYQGESQQRFGDW